MLKSHDKFFTENGKRLILIAVSDGEERNFLREILGEEFLLLFAADEKEAETLIREKGDVLSMVIAHLREPARADLLLLDLIQREPELRHIPVMVADEDRDIEIEALEKGAMAVIVLPYPMKEVILARVRRTIELSEDRAIISSTERDPLTGLYNREYFYRYAEQYDHHHKDRAMDAIVIDVNNFRSINERFGTDYGDTVLRRIGERVRDMVKDSGGIVCRREADTFQVYCPHGRSYQAILDNASIGLIEDESGSDRVRLRMGVYENVDKSLDIERRFDRANMAASSIRTSFTNNIAKYDITLHKKELEDARLVEDFHMALRKKQFRVCYQPKFDIRGDTPLLTSAEALVRWIHPRLGEISPGRFIPLFEENGLVQPLDHYVWDEVARQVQEWKQQIGFTVPISVNVSRVNMHDPEMVSFLMATLKKYGLTVADIYLEVTESAYTEDSDLIVNKVELLRDLGFRIEMDDFGTGYSSLNMISSLPIDVLKLDREIIQEAFREDRQNTRMMEIMLDIAEYLDVPVVAEGVETEAQLKALKEMGCEVIQGFYFSRPVPAEEFETFLLRRQLLGEFVPVSSNAGAHHRFSQRQVPPEEETEDHEAQMHEAAQRMFGGFNRLFVVDPVTERYTEYQPAEDGQGLRTEKKGSHFFDYTKRRMIQYMHPEDQKLFLRLFAKDNMARELAKKRSFSGVFRLMIGEDPSILYVQAAGLGDQDHRRFIIGIGNVDVKFPTEHQFQEVIRTIGRDALTGTKNMTAYIQEEKRINDAIGRKAMGPFAIAAVDMKGYRAMCRDYGQKAGNQAVQKLSGIVCDIFTHSPVYRIGDDKFAVLLRARDYESRHKLMKILREINEVAEAEEEAEDKVTFRSGVADFIPEEDHRLSNVFERAESQMQE